MELWISFIHSTDIEILMFACSLLDAMSKYKSGPWYNEDGSQKVLQAALCIKGCFKWIISEYFPLLQTQEMKLHVEMQYILKYQKKIFLRLG